MLANENLCGRFRQTQESVVPLLATGKHTRVEAREASSPGRDDDEPLHVMIVAGTVASAASRFSLR